MLVVAAIKVPAMAKSTTYENAMLCYWKDWRISGRGVLAPHELVNSMKAVQAARTDADTL